MPSLNMPVQRLKVATLPLHLPCSGPVTRSGEILTIGKSHGKKPDRYFLNDNMDVENYVYNTFNISVHQANKHTCEVNQQMQTCILCDQ